MCLVVPGYCFAASATVIVRSSEPHGVQRRAVADVHTGDIIMVRLWDCYFQVPSSPPVSHLAGAVMRTVHFSCGHPQIVGRKSP